MKTQPMDLSGRTILVTGASSGIGRETALLLGTLGARVVLTGRDAGRLAETHERLNAIETNAQGHHAEPFDLAMDVERIPAWMLDLANKLQTPFHGIAHCAGIHNQRPVRMLDASRFEEVQRVNVTTAVMLAKGFRQKNCRPPVGVTGGGSLVLMSSVAGLVGQASIAAYGASKAALIGLCKCLAIELAAEGIRANVVAAAMVRTELAERMFATLGQEQTEAIRASHPLGFGEPEDVANAIAFLLSGASRWITGSVMTVDGGYTAQ